LNVLVGCADSYAANIVDCLIWRVIALTARSSAPLCAQTAITEGVTRVERARRYLVLAGRLR
jgi:hypothetical protein